jgi:hypothetical protein
MKKPLLSYELLFLKEPPKDVTTNFGGPEGYGLTNKYTLLIRNNQ